MLPPAFISARDRDAWSTIRGFVYQVELIIEQWSTLHEASIIELELGEDIDLVRQGLDNDQLDVDRILQQVKHSERSVTLRKNSVTEFLAAVVEHRRSNPQLHLIFRYLTNAAPATERPSPLNPPRPAILAWKDLLSGPAPENHPDAVKIRTLLSSAERPPKLRDATWAEYREFLANATSAEFATLLGCVEWSTGSGDLDAVTRRVLDTLTAQHASGPDEAALIHCHLFEVVFSLLVTRGPKRLTKAEFIQHVRSTSKAIEDVSYGRVSQVLHEYESRLDALENSVRAQKPFLELLGRGMGIPASLSTSSPSLSFAAPPPPLKYVARPSLVNELELKLQDNRILALTAGGGYGKTQLARELMAGRHHTWLRLQGQDSLNSAWLLQQASSYATNNSHQILVIDGLGSFAGTEGLFDDMQLYAQQFKLIITSSYPLPLATRQNFEGALAEFAVPPFDSAATRDLLLLLGGPESASTDANLQLVLRITKGHPQLLLALARYLRDKSWNFADAVLTDMLSGAYARDVQQSVQKLIVESIPEPITRELLYRLDLVIGEIRNREVMAVSEVEPKVPLPGEKMQALVGPWAQQDTDSSLALSPLVRSLSRSNLDEEKIIRINNVLAQSILSVSSLDEMEALKAVLYSINGKNFERAAAVYASCALQMPDWYVRGNKLIMPPLWLGIQLPAAMSAASRVLIRAAQIRLSFLQGKKEVHHLIEEIEENIDLVLNSSDTKTIMTGVLAATICGTFPGEKSVAATQRVLISALNKIPTIGSTTPLVNEVYVNLFWAVCVSGSAVRNKTDLFRWLATMSLLCADDASFDERAFYLQSISAVSFKTLVADLEDTRKNVQPLDESLAKTVLQAAGSSNLFTAAIFAIRLKLSAEAQQLTTVDSLYHEGSKMLFGQEEAGFVLRAEYVERLWNWLFWDPSVRPRLFAEAEMLVLSSVELSPSKVLRGRLILSALLREADPVASMERLRDAELYVQNHPSLPRSDVVTMLGEKAIAVCELDGIAPGLAIWDMALEIMLGSEISEIGDKKALLALGHCTGYYSNLAHGGATIETSDGEEYTKPVPGLFLRIIDSAADLYRPEKLALLAAQLWTYAEDIQDDLRGEKWGRRALDLLERRGKSATRDLLVRTVLPFLLLEDAFSLALVWSVESAEAIGRSRPTRSFDVDVVAQYLVILPIFLRLATLSLLEDSAAKNAFEEVTNGCNARYAQSGSNAWASSAEIAGAFLSNKWERLVDIQKGAQAAGDSLTAAQAIFMRSLDPGVPCKKAVADHVVIVHFVFNHLAPTRLMCDKVIAPFLVAFWRKRLRVARFQFSTPDLVEQQLNDAVERRGEEGVRSILVAVLSGFSLNIPAEIRSWLTRR